MILRNIVSRLFVHLVFNCSNVNVIFRTYATFYVFPNHYGNTPFYHFNCIDKYLPLGGGRSDNDYSRNGRTGRF